MVCVVPGVMEGYFGSDTMIREQHFGVEILGRSSTPIGRIPGPILESNSLKGPGIKYILVGPKGGSI